MDDGLIIPKLEAYFNQTRQITYKKRTLILHPLDTPLSVFYIKSGYVRVFRISEEGEELTLTILKPNDFFPLTYGMNNTVNSYNLYLEALTKAELWRSPQDQFLSFVKKNPDILLQLTTRILVRFDGVLSRMEYLIYSSAYIKVATTLLICARKFGEPHGEDIIIQVPLTHRNIATLNGLTRETTSLEMKKLEKQGFLGRYGKLLLVKKVKNLEDEINLISQENPLLVYSL